MAMTPRVRMWVGLLCVVASAGVLQGCMGAQSWTGFVLTALLASMAGLAGCGRSAQGTREPCCIDGGRISVCECPPMTKCNYGIGWANNGDGTCSQGSPFGDAGISADTLSRSPDVGTDAGSDTGSIVDAPADILRVVPTDGFSYPCCGAGRVESCYCAAGTACNYAPFQVCPGGGCYNIVGATEPDGGNMCGVDGGSD